MAPCRLPADQHPVLRSTSGCPNLNGVFFFLLVDGSCVKAGRVRVVRFSSLSRSVPCLCCLFPRYRDKGFRTHAYAEEVVAFQILLISTFVKPTNIQTQNKQIRVIRMPEPYCSECAAGCLSALEKLVLVVSWFLKLLNYGPLRDTFWVKRGGVSPLRLFTPCFAKRKIG